MNILVTGFEPFLQHQANPTSEILGLLPKSIKGHTVITQLLPVAFEHSFDIVKQVIDRNEPQIIVMLGLAGGRVGITPERFAINRMDTLNPDNEGYQPIDTPIIADAPLAYESTLPLKAMKEKLVEKGIPSAISLSAGLYVCNNLFYHVMHDINRTNKQIYAGFIHVPYMDEMTKPDQAFSLPLHRILEGVLDCIKETIKRSEGQ